MNKRQRKTKSITLGKSIKEPVKVAFSKWGRDPKGKKYKSEEVVSLGVEISIVLTKKQKDELESNFKTEIDAIQELIKVAKDKRGKELPDLIEAFGSEELIPESSLTKVPVYRAIPPYMKNIKENGKVVSKELQKDDEGNPLYILTVKQRSIQQQLDKPLNNTNGLILVKYDSRIVEEDGKIKYVAGDPMNPPEFISSGTPIGVTINALWDSSYNKIDTSRLVAVRIYEPFTPSESGSTEVNMADAFDSEEEAEIVEFVPEETPKDEQKSEDEKKPTTSVPEDTEEPY